MDIKQLVVTSQEQLYAEMYKRMRCRYEAVKQNPASTSNIERMDHVIIQFYNDSLNTPLEHSPPHPQPQNASSSNSSSPTTVPNKKKSQDNNAKTKIQKSKKKMATINNNGTSRPTIPSSTAAPSIPKKIKVIQNANGSCLTSFRLCNIHTDTYQGTPRRSRLEGLLKFDSP